MSDRVVDIFYAIHQGSWAFLPLLAIVAYFLYKAGKKTGATIVHMILRLFYLLMIVSGGALVFAYDFPLNYIIKGILAILLIGFFEMTLGKAKRGAPAMVGWLLVLITAVIVVLMGFNVITF